ncbi:hypothetical protein CHS0354_031866 [Potamilus streckersoni]|uniref:Ras-associating domain-containing protein n=1 Tax=Potamilus streckersoni TaxID=2493646 RepID=A0AAE0RY03_9BIVA|nr:hypothetical protein CHS0354_031866 [Potamilus streckersoni]
MYCGYIVIFVSHVILKLKSVIVVLFSYVLLNGNQGVPGVAPLRSRVLQTYEAAHPKIKMKTIAVVVEGEMCYQEVTKNTSCGDLVRLLLKHHGKKEHDTSSYFIYASNNITEQQLSNKTKIMKAAEDLMSGTNGVHFLLRKKSRRFLPNLSIAKCRRLRENSPVRELKGEIVKPISLPITNHTAIRERNEEVQGVKQLCQIV